MRLVLRTVLATAAVVACYGQSSADDCVSGYYKANGTYVSGYCRSDRDNTVTDNFSFEGNSNPYTGSAGTNRYQHDLTSPYFNGTPQSNGLFGHQDQDDSGY